MNQTLQPTREAPAAVGGRDLARVASAIRSEWRAGATPNAAAALAADTQLAADRPLAIDLAYDEFCLREQAGEAIDPKAFADRFTFAASLFRLIQIHGLLNHHPDLIPVGRPAVQHHPGDRLGDYEIVRPLGQGGFADVYLARECSAGGRGVVLKLSAHNEHEADTLGPLSHPHLMSVYSAPNINGLRAVVMPFFGVTTAERLVTARAGDRRPNRGRDFLRLTTTESRPGDPPVRPSPPFAVRPNEPYLTAVRAVARGVAAALAYLHARGVAHRDIKPANILLGTTGHPYLLDFNLAIDSTGGERIGGTLPYLAPEVLAVLSNDTSDSAAKINWQTADVFSFGVVMWELLTGRHPYLTGVPLRTVSGHMRQAGVVVERQDQFFRDASSRRLQSHGAMWRLIERCLAPIPTDRPTAAELERVLAPKPRRFPALITAAGVGACLLSGGALVWGQFPKPDSPIGQPIPNDEFAKGTYFYRLGQIDLATAAFAKAGKANNDGKAYSYAAFCHAREKNAGAATFYAGLARAAGYDDLPLCLTSAYGSLLNNDLASALVECEAALKLDPSCRPALLTRWCVRSQQAQKNNLPPDRSLIADFEAASRDSHLPGSLWLQGATMYLVVDCRTQTDLDYAAEAVRHAVNSDAKIQSIVKTRVHSHLKSHPVYQKAINSIEANNPPKDNPHLISPIR